MLLFFLHFKFSNIWLKCYEKDWFYTISENLAVHCSFSCSIIHYPIVGDEPFFIWMAENIFGADPDPFKYFLQFFCYCRELYPFTDQHTLVVFSKVRDKCLKWIIMIVGIADILSSCSLYFRSSSGFWQQKSAIPITGTAMSWRYILNPYSFAKEKQTRDCCCVLCLICLW